MIQLAAKYNVAHMMEQDDFNRRFRSGGPWRAQFFAADAGLFR
jgi:hypothetical protein